MEQTCELFRNRCSLQEQRRTSRCRGAIGAGAAVQSRAVLCRQWQFSANCTHAHQPTPNHLHSHHNIACCFHGRNTTAGKLK